MSQNIQGQIQEALNNPKTTKGTLTSLLEQAADALVAKAEGKVDLTGEADAKRVADAIANAEGIANGNIAVRFAELSNSIAKALGETGNELGQIAKEFADLTTARDAIAKEVNELTGVKAASLKLAAVVNAQKDAVAAHDTLMAEKRAEMQALIDSTNAYVEQAEAEVAAKIAQLEADAKAARDRAETEWKYNFNRKQRQDLDTLDDQLKVARQLHQEAVDADNKKLDEREEALDKREIELGDKADHYASLEEKVAGFDAAVTKAANAQVAIVTASMKKDHDNAVALIQAEHKSTVQILENKVDGLEGQVARLEAQLAEAQRGTADAVNKVKDIALASVEGAAQAKVVVQQQSQAEQGFARK